MNILVTGGAGFIGSHLVDRLLADGHRVIVWDHTKRFTPESKAQYIEEKNKIGQFEYHFCGISWIGELSEIYTMEKLGGPFDLIYHLAADSRIIPSFDHPTVTFYWNVVGTLNVLQLAKNIKAKVIFTSSSCVDDTDHYLLNPYAMTKKHGEDLCQIWHQIYGLDVSVVRPFNVYGPQQLEDGPYSTVLGIFEKQLRENKPFTITGDGTQRRDFIHVDDVVDGLIKIAEYTEGFNLFLLGTGVNYSLNEIAKMFKPVLDPLYLPKRPGELQETLADTSHMRAIGWEPKHQLEDYINELLNR